MKKSSLLFLTLAMTTWSWIRQPLGSLVEHLRTSLKLSEDDAVRALAWLRTELHNLAVAPPGDWSGDLVALQQEAEVLKALCAALDAVPAVYMWVDDAVVEGRAQQVVFPLSEGLERLAQELAEQPARLSAASGLGDRRDFAGWFCRRPGLKPPPAKAPRFVAAKADCLTTSAKPRVSDILVRSVPRAEVIAAARRGR